MTPQQPTKHAAKTISHCFSILLTNLRFHFFLLPFALSLLALVSFGTKTAQAQTIPTAEQSQTLPPIYPQIRFGLFGAANLNWHAASFSALPNIPVRNFDFAKDTISFGSATSIVPAFGLALESVFSPLLGLSARLSYANHDALFNNQDSYPAIDPLGRNYDLFSTVNLQSRLASIALEPTLILTPFPLAGLKIYGGARIGFLLTRSFEQKEVLSSNEIGAFTTDPQERNPRNGTIPSANPLALSALAGIGYEIPLEGLTLAGGMGRLSVQPEVFGMWGLNPVVEGLAWNLHQLRAGISIFYRQEETLQRFEEYRRVDTIIVYQKRIRNPFMVGISQFRRDTVMSAENGKRLRIIRETLQRVDTAFSTPPPRMDVEIAAVGVNEKGEEKKLVQLRLEEFVVQRYVPLLNYVFFDDQSSVLDERYARLKPETSALFDVNSLYRSETLTIYRNMLNIIGKRMRQFPDAVITLTGCTSGIGAEDGNTALSAARAEIVRRYLLDVWSIGSNRIIMKARNLSEQASLPKTEADKIEENRRVEITSSVREVLDPILLSDTMRVTNPPTIRFLPSVKTEKPITEWSLTAFSEGKDVKQFSSEDSTNADSKVVAGANPESKLPTRIDWSPPKQGENSLRLENNIPLEFTLTARDADGKNGFAHGFIPVEHVILPDKKIEQFSLVLFGFNKSEISDQNQRIIGFINSVIRPNSKVTIGGYTDRTGDNAYNRTLSRQRAAELARLIDQPLSKAQGFGEDTLLYDNTTPEGRFYCRTVNVSVETAN
jgi:outer membrane protein OmpA-like peptidoglycan-associated protein